MENYITAFEELVNELARDVVCNKCGRRGHKGEDCRTVCYSCKEFGHIAPKCPYRKEEEKRDAKEKVVRQHAC